MAPLFFISGGSSLFSTVLSSFVFLQQCARSPFSALTSSFIFVTALTFFYDLYLLLLIMYMLGE